MATAATKAAELAGPAPKDVNPRTRLAVASLVGGAFVTAGVVVAAYVVPQVWDSALAPALAGLNSLAIGFLRVVTQVAVAAGIIWAGTAVAGKNPPRGLRGGILIVVSAAIAIFFVVRAVGLNTEGMEGVGRLITLVVLGGLLGLAFRGLLSARGKELMEDIEGQGWLHAFSYKATQGQKVRRYTLIGLLILGWSGVYSLLNHQSLGTGLWVLDMPFTAFNLTPLADIQYTVPLLLAAATFWLTWRAVNMPVFADFLIATEAEMNKVSWSSRKRLFQDTIVVLVTTLLLTAFLLLTDLFWGWLLTTVKVLPPRTQTATQVDALGGKKVNW